MEYSKNSPFYIIQLVTDEENFTGQVKELFKELLEDKATIIGKLNEFFKATLPEESAEKVEESEEEFRELTSELSANTDSDEPGKELLSGSFLDFDDLDEFDESDFEDLE